MFAVVQAGGRQLQVAPSDVIRIDRIEAQAGSEVSLGKVLLLRTQNQTHIGTPLVEGAEVRAQVLGEQLGDKIRVFFYRRRKNSKKMRGHRQLYTMVRVNSLLFQGQVVAEAAKQEAKAAAAPAAETAPASAEGSAAPQAAAEGAQA